jgi:hypothetical protein
MKLRWWWSVALACVLAGCASGGSVDSKDETLSLVYGYFDMKDAPTKVEWVSLKQYDLQGKQEGAYQINAKDGLFFHIGIEPGSYQVDKFGGGGGFLSTPVEYNFGGKGRNATAVRVQKPGVYFVGVHKYVDRPGKGFFSADKFEMQPAKAPSEKELLRQVIQRIESDKELAPYTRQLQHARQRLGQL